MTYQPTIGVIIEGTLANDDLLSAFASELRRFDATSSLVAEANAVALLEACGYGVMDSEQAAELVDALRNALSDRAPAYMTFDTSEGDGACFGWWPCVEAALEDLPHVEAGNEPTNGVSDYVTVNDHGNVTLYVQGREVWSVV